MPNIREYTNPVNEVHPSEAGSAAFELEGRHIGSDIDIAGRYVGNAITQVGNTYEQYDTQQDIANLGKLTAHNFLDTQTAWDEAVKGYDSTKMSPADFQKQWLDQTFEPSVQKVMEAARTRGGQEWAERWANQHREDWVRHTSADMISLSGANLAQSTTEANNDYSQAAYRAGDYSTMNTILQQSDGTFEAHLAASNLKGADAARARDAYLKDRKQIAVAAAFGAIQKNPAQFKQDLASGKFGDYYNGQEVDELNRRADEKLKANLVDARQADIERRRAVTDKARAGLSSVFDKLLQQPVMADGRHAPYPGMANDIINLPDDDEGIKAAGFHLTEHEGRQAPQHSNEGVRAMLSEQVIYGNDKAAADRAVLAAHERGDLTDADMIRLHGLAMKVDKDPVMKAATIKLNKFLADERRAFFPNVDQRGIYDPTAEDRFYQYKSVAEAALDQALSSGDQAKINGLFTTNNENYIGKMRDFYSLDHKGATLPYITPNLSNSGVLPGPVHYGQQGFQAPPPPPGSIVGGKGDAVYRYKGGDRTKPENYERIK